MLLVDTNVLLDIFENDKQWVDWSLAKVRGFAQLLQLSIDPIVYAELSVCFASVVELDAMLSELQIDLVAAPREALFLAGRKFVGYRRRGGPKSNVLPDFLIGAHAAVRQCPILTRDTRRYRTYFSSVQLIAPDART
ncbi:MAG TPA: type II toxin-antitoxin system VapC family toxin [Rudaea sp.]|jgi:hypothetical protein|nr:type II toxin-antitoxin system VapC family toxin [Rudaea sp.]